jgi:ribonucleoside-diphosphate reductase alpha chain
LIIKSIRSLAAEVATKARRSLGIGYIGLAHYLAKLGFKYDSQGAWDAVHGLSESFQYFLLKASNKIAQEKGYCESFGRTKYSDGLLPIDTYKKDVDEISSVKLNHDWEGLRASILKARSQALHTVRTDALREQFCGI